MSAKCLRALARAETETAEAVIIAKTMAGRFYERPNDLYLKPMHLVDTASIHSRTGSNASYYNPVPHDNNPNQSHLDTSELHHLETYDNNLKQRIRILKLISRISATILSAITFGFLLATIIKFLLTKDIYFEVDGVKRTAWAHNTITWYTYMYFSISAISLLLNTLILLAYIRSIRAANRVSTASTIWTWAITISHISIWIASVAIYRYGKEPVNGKFRDLWGWTCSSTAKELQDVLTSVNFQRYCNVQSSGWYSGLANVGMGVLGAVILGLAVRRREAKGRVLGMRRRMGGDLEPLRFAGA
ncbi:uncharacterized protein MYCFIDRAFT_79060 [Pseudocercospora fijiensis CIRAD86]|uniref:MARVEL domain-containing protein n=1 Tax=Pseudocercospora fijiensis (strain CIRAD86) TaxID=383855 RepID=M3A071_PSEFD|nr:uncharacterized protein MYCFIDRAFT_79060 [Pseudocercospora fijiensis CIRAD86]EME77796.1 hypothetical protein MYCFIDRAFT_79060 [Pseudocercospora fijiensis CIRAD86]